MTLRLHYPLGLNGNKFVYKDDKTGKYYLASYSTRMHTPEVMLFNCDGLGNVENWSEVYSEQHPDMTPKDLFKVVDRYNRHLDTILETFGEDRMP